MLLRIFSHLESKNMNQSYIQEFINELEKLNPETNARYKMLIFQNGQLSTKFSTHKIVIDNEPFFYTVAKNKWIYLYTDDIFMPEFDGWRGDHFTIGYIPNDIQSIPDNPDDIILLHKTNYLYNARHKQFRRKSVYCNINQLMYILQNCNAPCFSLLNNIKTDIKIGDTTAQLNEMFSTSDYNKLRNFLSKGLNIRCQTGGSKIKYKNKSYKVYIGKRGGKYIKVDKKKIYLSSSSNNKQTLKGGDLPPEPSDKDIINFIDKNTPPKDYSYACVILDNQEKQMKVMYECNDKNSTDDGESFRVSASYDNMGRINSSQLIARPQKAFTNSVRQPVKVGSN
jgi:hypothetical protein